MGQGLIVGHSVLSGKYVGELFDVGPAYSSSPLKLSREYCNAAAEK